MLVFAVEHRRVSQPGCIERFSQSLYNGGLFVERRALRVVDFNRKWFERYWAGHNQYGDCAEHQLNVAKWIGDDCWKGLPRHPVRRLRLHSLADCPERERQ